MGSEAISHLTTHFTYLLLYACLAQSWYGGWACYIFWTGVLLKNKKLVVGRQDDGKFAEGFSYQSMYNF